MTDKTKVHVKWNKYEFNFINDIINKSFLLIGNNKLITMISTIMITFLLSYYSIQYVVAGISASLLWIIYQYRKGANFSVLYSTAGLLLGMYTLQRVLKERKDKKLE